MTTDTTENKNLGSKLQDAVSWFKRQVKKITNPEKIPTKHELLNAALLAVKNKKILTLEAAPAILPIETESVVEENTAADAASEEEIAEEPLEPEPEMEWLTPEDYKGSLPIAAIVTLKALGSKFDPDALLQIAEDISKKSLNRDYFFAKDLIAYSQFLTKIAMKSKVFIDEA